MARREAGPKETLGVRRRNEHRIGLVGRLSGTHRRGADRRDGVYSCKRSDAIAVVAESWDGDSVWVCPVGVVENIFPPSLADGHSTPAHRGRRDAVRPAGDLLQAPMTKLSAVASVFLIATVSQLQGFSQSTKS